MEEKESNCEENRLNPGVSRRSVLRATSSLGALSLGTLPVGARGSKEKIVTLMEGDEVAEKRWVSRQWYQHLEHVRRVKNKFAESVLQNPRVRTVGIIPVDKKYGTLRGFGIKVKTDEKASATGIPDSVETVPVFTEKSGPFQDGCYTGYKSILEGGIGCNTEEGYDGTLCCRATKGGNTYLLTTRHVFTGNGTFCSDDNTVGKTWFQGDGDKAGKVEYAYQNHDAVLLDTSATSRSVEDTIIDENGTVVGRVTKDGADYLMSNNSTVHSRGRTSCDTSGQIVGGDQIIQCYDDYIGNVIESSTTFDDGDSGGPVYYQKSNGDVYIVHIATHYNGSPPGNAHGSAAFAMHNKRNISFGGDAFTGN